MKIHNVRLGFATNSSSSHSIIFDASIHPQDDYNDFGWSYFTVSSSQAKLAYVTATLHQNLSRSLPNELVNAIIRGLDLPDVELSSWGYPELSVDHQSLFALPHAFGTNQVSLEFFEEFRDYLVRDGVHILGGNDNDDEEHDLDSESKRLSFGDWGPDRPVATCRRDGDWWTLYSPGTGDRVVLSFKDNPAPYAPETPALVDIKVTDYCDHGCAYCYQGSTIAGQHMDDGDIYAYTKLLSEAKVFEIAVGGGEPTQFPRLVEFISACRRRGIIVNFTTKSTDWLEDQQRADTILPLIGAFAYSADARSMQTLERIHTIFKYRNYDLRKFTVQIIPAAMNEYEFKNLMTTCHRLQIRATLLGFKETGRGAKFKEIAINRSWNRFDETKWIEVIKELYEKCTLHSISIDTTMAARYQNHLQESGIPDWLYHIHEGRYSMYIDAVNHQCGPSSYHLEHLRPVNKHTDKLRDIFKQIEAV